MKKFLLCSIALLSGWVALAQTNLTGTVVDAQSGKPITGATVTVKGSARGVTSGNGGEFALQVSPGETLVVSFLGMKTREITIAPAMDQIEVKLESDALNVEEVLVVGYGVTRKRDLAGAITSMKRDDVKAGVVTDLSSLLKGRAAGVQVKTNSLEPGGSISIRVRGASSISSNNEPLYSIDGFLTDDAGYVNPDDIQSIEILKDAAATSIYGSRGANGVVLITTKKGIKDQYRVEYSLNTSFKRLKNPWDLMDARDAIDYNMKIWRENGSQGNPPYTDEQLKFHGAGTDWLDLTTRTGFTQTHQVSNSGGNDRVTVFGSANYAGDKGILYNTDFERWNGRINVDMKVNTFINDGATVSAVKSTKGYLNMGTNASTDNVMYSIFMLSPTLLPDGKNVFGESERRATIMDEINDHDQKNSANQVYAGIYADIKIAKPLTFRASYIYNNENLKQQRYYPRSTVVGQAVDGSAFVSNEKADRSQLDALLTYDQTFGIHHLKLIAGASRITYVAESSEMDALGFATDMFGYHNMSLAQTINYISTGRTENEKRSFFGRGEYVLNDKYIFNVSFRADYATHFGRDNRWGYFPSASFAWQLGDEPFMEFARPLFSTIKLRASYGQNGNDGIGYGLSQFQYRVSDVYLGGDALQKMMYPYNPRNDELTWETTSQFDIGLDLALWNSRIEVNFDWYYKKTTDLLNPVNISTSAGGFETYMGNNGELENKGFELFIKSNNFSRPDFSWSTTLNLSHNKNKVLRLSDMEAKYEQIRPHGHYNFEDYVMLKPGYSLSSIYGYKFAGIIQTGETYAPQPTSVAGDPKFVDVDGNGTIDLNDRTVLGDGNPDVIIGLGNNFRWKNFDFSFFLESAVGHKLLNLTRVLLEDENRLRASMDRWTQANPSNSIPRNGYRKDAGVKYGSYINSRFVEDASYLRLQNIEIGYNLPIAKWGGLSRYIKACRIYVGAQNLFVLTGYTGFDPDVSTNGGNPVAQGLDFSSYPAYRMYNCGLKITF